LFVTNSFKAAFIVGPRRHHHQGVSFL